MALIKLDLDNLVDRPPLDPAILNGPSPRITGRTFLTSAVPAVTVVAWGASPYAIHAKTRPDYEFSILLRGRFTLSLPEIGDEAIAAGDMFVLPPTCLYRWSQSEPTMKFALSYRPDGEVSPAQSFTPLREASLTASGSGEQDLFTSHDGKMVVKQVPLAAGAEIAHSKGSIAIGKLISGSISIESQVLQSGDCFALDAADDLKLQAHTEANLVICTIG
ncbi:hypothetical protein FPY71_11065 [Aureimonas fodinaquatilis]|uniref:Cupin domain-containing protein n=1 Tax=Aureimonas fodinaquatilis TaxID=2565783 RepID=A0A5B0DZ08_9HYPH|nr:hypothetical protein [Aureimonas fodinaquatilis]KAA0970991.1 hypothetical protein FPY71_11065 [Aureimonas fodinaquatilis]